MLDSSSILKRKAEELYTRWHCKYDILQMSHGLKSLKRFQRREALSSKDKGEYSAVFHSPSIVCSIRSGLCTSLCFEIEAVEQKGDTFFGHSLLYHYRCCVTNWGACWCRSCTRQSVVVHNRLLPVPRSHGISLTSVELWHWQNVLFNVKNDILIQNWKVL